MQINRRRILVPHGAVSALARAEGVSRDAVREALGGLSGSEQAMRLRELAIKEYGGVLTPL